MNATCFNGVADFDFPLEDLQGIAISDKDIVTEKDVAYCGGTVKNANVHPHSLLDDGSVWRVGNRRWNEDWEKKFAEWVEKEIDKDFFKRYKIYTDCADAAISVRAIFARIHHLPVMFAGRHFSQSQKKWAREKTVKNWDEQNWKTALMEDIRFRKALEVWKLGVGTVNLHEDTFPLRVRRESDTTRLASCVRPGTVLLTRGHTRFTKKVDSLSWNPVEELSSTVPSAIRTLSQGPVSLSNFPASESSAKKPDRGVLGWNWIVNCNGKFVKMADSKMPNYSREQYEFHKIYGKNYKNLLAELGRAKALTSPEKEDIDKLVKSLKESLESRVETVTNGYQAYLQDPEAFEDVEGRSYDNYSTPTRDKAILDRFDALEFIIKKHSDSLGMNMADLYKKLSEVKVEITPGKTVNAVQVLWVMRTDESVSDPRVPIEKRWGLELMESEDFIKGQKEKLNMQRRALADYQKKYKEIKENIESSRRGLQRSVNVTVSTRLNPYLSPLSLLSERFAEGYSNDLRAETEDLIEYEMMIEHKKTSIELHKALLQK